MKSFFLILVLAFGLSSVSKAQEAPRADYPATVKNIEETLNHALAQFEAGKVNRAQGNVSDAYFDFFEASGMEIAVGTLSPALKTDLESQFNHLRSAMGGNESVDTIKGRISNLVGQLQATAYQLGQERTFWTIFVSSLMILLREGFEAILIIGAIVAFLIKTKRQDQLTLVRSSVSVALVASLFTAFALQLLFKVSAAQQELIEGLTMIVASIVLFTVGHWLIAQAESQRWSKYIKDNIKDSLSQGSRRALWLTCFLAVYREGAETVLFYQALWSSAARQSTAIYSGFAAAAILLILIFFAFKRGALRIPMKPFFRITSTLLYFLGFVFAGRAAIELQAGGYLLVNEIKGFPTIDFLGIYPTWESVVLQSAFLLALLLSCAWILFRKKHFSVEAA